MPVDPLKRSFIRVDKNHQFPIQNLPYGVFDDGDGPRVGVAIGSKIIDMKQLEKAGKFTFIEHPVFDKPRLNDFMELGYDIWMRTRERLVELMDADNPELRDDDMRSQVFLDMDRCIMLLPVEIGEFTDFYSSYYHAFNVGSLIRGPENALMPNWKHLPVAYHGRASSVVASGTPIRRPVGQTKSPDSDMPSFGPTERLDFELEMGFFVGTSNVLGQPVKIEDTYRHIFGMVLVNDWSARDVQVWEYRPLGPFLSKNFATSISPWVVTLDALEPFRVAGGTQDPEVLPYLRMEGDNAYDIDLEVAIKSSEMKEEFVLTRSNATNLYWNIFQQLAHHTITGCNMQVGDLCGSGTISGQERGTRGCMLEISELGRNPINISDTEKRTYLVDGDVITMTGYCQGDGYRVGFGEVSTEILPSGLAM